MPQSLPGRDEVDHLIVALLREEDPDWPGGDVGAIATSLCIRSRQHGVVSLMAGRLASRNDWPIEVREALQLEAISTSFWELRHQEILAETISMMRSRAIEPVLFKGTALAYSHYPSPHLRRRGDTDMIVAPGDVIKAAAALEELEFIRSGGVSGDVVSYQDSYAKDVDVTGAARNRSPSAVQQLGTHLKSLHLCRASGVCRAAPGPVSWCACCRSGARPPDFLRPSGRPCRRSLLC